MWHQFQQIRQQIQSLSLLLFFSLLLDDFFLECFLSLLLLDFSLELVTTAAGEEEADLDLEEPEDPAGARALERAFKPTPSDLLDDLELSFPDKLAAKPARPNDRELSLLPAG